ncbi:MAG: ATP synthase subunit I [Halieaceae bacterium]|jgi:ATP synthase protein I|nr:ATP synthase subunit I [Halieaceae bacterium]
MNITPRRYLRPSLYQLLTLGVLSPVLLVSIGGDASVAFMAGGLCALVPQAYFGLRMGTAARRGAAHAARAGLAAEGGKFLLSAVAFALVFAVIKPAAPLFVFVGFAMLWIAQTVGAASLLR